MRRFVAAALFLGACSSRQDEGARRQTDTLVVFTAASLAAPVRAALDSFRAGDGVTVQQESGAKVKGPRAQAAAKQETAVKADASGKQAADPERDNDGHAGEALPPGAHIQWAEHLAWAETLDQLPKFERFPA